jgi:hypothetical protein
MHITLEMQFKNLRYFRNKSKTLSTDIKLNYLWNLVSYPLVVDVERNYVLKKPKKIFQISKICPQFLKKNTDWNNNNLP